MDKDIGVVINTVQNLPHEWEMPAEWKLSSKGKEALKVAVSMGSSKHGLYASVPIVCKGKACPYVSTCSLDDYDLTPVGERCPVEIAEVMKAFEEYNAEFEIDIKSRVDLGLLKELIDIEITINRCNHLLARDGAMVQDTIAVVSPKGDAYYRPEIHKAADLKDKLQRRKIEILKTFNATRQDKAKDEGIKMDPSTYASMLIAKARELQKLVVIDVEPICKEE